MQTVEKDLIDDSVLDDRFKKLIQRAIKIPSLSRATYGIYIPGKGYYDIGQIKDQILGDRIKGAFSKIISSDQFGLHFKYNPSSALNEKIAYLVDKLLFRTSNEKINAVVNPTQLVVVKCDQFFDSVLATQTIFGPQLRSELSADKNSKLKNINSDNFSRLYILHLLLRPGDAKTDNFILSNTGRLVAIDHENIFAEDAVVGVNDGVEFSTTHIASVAFLLDHLFTEIDEQTKQLIIKLDIESLIFRLFNELERYTKPSEGCPAKWHIDLNFKQGAIARFYRDLKLVQTFCKENSHVQTSHAQLMQFVNPNLYRFYREFKQHAHHNYFSIEKMVGTAINQGSPDKKKSISFEEFGLQKPTYKKVATQLDLMMQNAITLSEAKEEFVNDIDFEGFTAKKRDRVLAEITTLARRTTHFQLNNCAVALYHFNRILQLPLKKLTLHGVQFNTDDLLYFIKQSKASVELYRCPSVTYQDLNSITNNRGTNVTITIRINDKLLLTIFPLNERTAADYLHQVDQHIKKLSTPIPTDLLELKKYMLSKKFYNHAHTKLTTDYHNGDIDDFVQHTLFTVIKWSNNFVLPDKDRILLNRKLYKVLHWRHQKLFMQIIKHENIFPATKHRELIEQDLLQYRQKQSSHTKKSMAEISKINESNWSAVKNIYIYKNQCKSLCTEASKLVDSLVNDINTDCFFSEQDLLPFLETLKEIHDLIATCGFSRYRRLLSLKFLSGTAFDDKFELLTTHRQVFFTHSQNILKERLADRENDLAEARVYLDNMMKDEQQLDQSSHSNIENNSVQQLQNQFRSAVENTINSCRHHNVTVNGLHIPLQEITILRLINSDTYSEVYLAEYQYTPVIIKKLTQKKKTQQAKFKRDIELRKKLRHRNIAELKGVDDSLKEPIMVIDTDSTKTLKQYLIETLLDDQQKFRLVVGIARALYQIHEVHNTAHGNLCSQNILITESGEPLLDNFGFAVADEPTLLPTSAYNNVLIKYFPPEANHHCLIARPAIDIYCFGILVDEIYSAQGQCLPMPVNDINKATTQNYFPSFIKKLVHDCTKISAIHRPSITGVLEALKKHKPLDSKYRDNQIDSINKQIDRAEKLVGQALERRSSNSQNKLTEIRELYESAREDALRLAQLTGSYRAYCIVGHLNILLLCELQTDRLFGKQFTSSLEVNRDECIGNAFKFFNLTVRYYPEYPKAKGYLKAYAEDNPHKEKQGSNDRSITNHGRK